MRKLLLDTLISSSERIVNSKSEWEALLLTHSMRALIEKEKEYLYVEEGFYHNIKGPRGTFVFFGYRKYKDLTKKDKEMYNQGLKTLVYFLDLRQSCEIEELHSSISYLCGRKPTKKDLLTVVRRYHINKLYETLWVSHRGTWFAGSKPVKPGKLLKSLYPTAEQWEIEVMIERVRVGKRSISNKDIFIGEVEEVYLSDELKIRSCMTKNHVRFNLYKELGVKALALKDSSGNYVARTLLWPSEDGKLAFYDRIYATEKALEIPLKRYLHSRGIRPVKEVKYTSRIIEGKIDDYFLPYMDNVQYLYKVDNKFYLTNRSEEGKITYLLTTTYGGYN